LNASDIEWQRQGELMKGGILRSALTTTLPLELEYRELSIHWHGSESDRPKGFQHPEGPEDEFALLLTLI
jgi:hypothetical protein